MAVTSTPRLDESVLKAGSEAVALAIKTVKAAGSFTPFLIVLSGGSREVVHFDKSPTPATDLACDLINAPKMAVEGYAIAFDGFITLDGARYEAVIVELGQRDHEQAVRFAQRYHRDPVCRPFGKQIPIGVSPTRFSKAKDARSDAERLDLAPTRVLLAVTPQGMVEPADWEWLTARLTLGLGDDCDAVAELAGAALERLDSSLEQPLPHETDPLAELRELSQRIDATYSAADAHAIKRFLYALGETFVKGSQGAHPSSQAIRLLDRLARCLAIDRTERWGTADTSVA